MAVIPFPSPVMTLEDEAVIIARASSVGYRCRCTTDQAGHRAILMTDVNGRLRGRVTKAHGVYAVSDSRDHVVASGRSRDDVLRALEQ